MYKYVNSTHIYEYDCLKYSYASTGTYLHVYIIPAEALTDMECYLQQQAMAALWNTPRLHKSVSVTVLEREGKLGPGLSYAVMYVGIR